MKMVVQVSLTIKRTRSGLNRMVWNEATVLLLLMALLSLISAINVMIQGNYFQGMLLIFIAINLVILIRIASDVDDYRS